MTDWADELFGGGRPAPIDQDALRGGQARPRAPIAPPAGPSPQETPDEPVGPAGRFANPGMAPSATHGRATDWTSELFGGGAAADRPAQSPSDKVMGIAKGLGEKSLFRRMGDAIAGEHDPAYEGIKSFNEEMDTEGNKRAIGQMAVGTLVAGDDARFGDVMKDALGDRFVRKETTKSGHDVIVYKGTDGTEKKAYVNKPGLDAEDVTRGAMGAIPYIVPAAKVAKAVKAAPGIVRSAAQFVTGFGTSAATDVASMGLGSEQGVDPVKAGVIGGLGAAGEGLAVPAAALYRKFVTVPGLVDKASGTLTDKGAAAAKAAGLDPEAIRGELASQFAKTYAKSPDAARAGARFATDAQGIPSTVGQRSKDAEQLLNEKGMRYGLQGDNAKAIMQDFDRRQAEAVKGAAVGRYGGADPAAVPVREGVAFKLAPHREVADLTAPDLGQGVRSGLQEAKGAAKTTEKAAWDKVGDIGDLLPHPNALTLLPEAIGKSLGTMRPDSVTTPVAYKMAETLSHYMAGKPMQSELAVLSSQSGGTSVVEMQRRLGAMMRATANDTDRSMAGSIYHGFNDWIDTAAAGQMLLGKPEAAAALRAARGVSKEIKDLFVPVDRMGKKTPGAGILSDVMEKSDSAEGIVSGLFGGGPQANIKDGGVEALLKIRNILDTHANKEVAANTWNDIRAAYWMRLVQDKKGDMHTPGVMLNNIKTALSNQRSVVNILYPKDDMGNILMLKKSLEAITYKDPNPSGSGVAAASFAKQFLGKLMDAVGVNSKLGQAVLAYSGAQRAYGTAAAKSATSQAAAPASRPALAGPAAAFGSMYYDRNGLDQ